MPLRYFALYAALLPFVAVHACYLISAWQGYVEWCVPYLAGCTSISGTGRHGMAYFLFKGMMIPGAVVLAFYWWLNSEWLLLMGDKASHLRQTIVILGLVASIGLIVYSVALGSIGESYRLQRRIGVILYFGLTYLAQLLMTHRLASLALDGVHTPFRCQLALCLLMLIVGLLHLAIEAVLPGLKGVDDMVEWNIALLMSIYYLSSYWLWRLGDIRLTLQKGAT